MQDPEKEAQELWEQGTAKLMASDLTAAIDLFDRSIGVLPSAEGYTYRGWAYSFQGRLDDAITECERAIECDPTFGNPYNDIGCYLMQKGDMEGAEPWLERAKKAPRYEPKHFPYINLGRIYLSRGDVARAKTEFRGALELHPGDPVALTYLSALRG